MEIGPDINSMAILSPSADSRMAVVSYWWKNVHKVLINCLGGLPRNSVDRLTDHIRNYLKVSKSRKTPAQQVLVLIPDVL